MTPEELDTAYAQLCRELREVDSAQVAHFLARLVLLLFSDASEPELVASAIHAACETKRVTT